MHRRRGQIRDGAGRHETGIGGDRSPGRELDAEASDRAALGEAEERIALVGGEERLLLVGGHRLQHAADVREGCSAWRQQATRDERLPEAPVGPSVRSGVSHPHAGAIGETEKAGALDVQQEHVDRIGGPAELQAPAGQRPGLDLGAGRKRPEVTVYESADDRPARAPRVEPSGIDAHQIGGARVEGKPVGLVGAQATVELRLVVAGEEERAADAHDAKGARHRAPAGFGVGHGVEDLEQPAGGVGVGGPRVRRHGALDRVPQRPGVEVLLQRRELSRADADERTARADPQCRTRGEQCAAERQRRARRGHAS